MLRGGTARTGDKGEDASSQGAMSDVDPEYQPQAEVNEDEDDNQVDYGLLYGDSEVDDETLEPLGDGQGRLRPTFAEQQEQTADKEGGEYHIGIDCGPDLKTSRQPPSGPFLVEHPTTTPGNNSGKEQQEGEEGQAARTAKDLALQREKELALSWVEESHAGSPFHCIVQKEPRYFRGGTCERLGQIRKTTGSKRAGAPGPWVASTGGRCALTVADHKYTILAPVRVRATPNPEDKGWVYGVLLEVNQEADLFKFADTVSVEEAVGDGNLNDAQNALLQTWLGVEESAIYPSRAQVKKRKAALASTDGETKTQLVQGSRKRKSPRTPAPKKRTVQAEQVGRERTSGKKAKQPKRSGIGDEVAGDRSAQSLSSGHEPNTLIQNLLAETAMQKQQIVSQKEKASVMEQQMTDLRKTVLSLQTAVERAGQTGACPSVPQQSITNSSSSSMATGASQVQAPQSVGQGNSAEPSSLASIIHQLHPSSLPPQSDALALLGPATAHQNTDAWRLFHYQAVQHTLENQQLIATVKNTLDAQQTRSTVDKHLMQLLFAPR